MLNFDVPNTLPLILMIVAATIGGFDVLYYHLYKFRLYEQPSSRAEMITHLLRGILFGIGAYLLVNFEPRGHWFYFLAGIFILDFINSIADVYFEPASRKPLGGLPPNEYIVHIVGTALAGAITMAYFILFWKFKDLPTALEPLKSHSLPIWLSIQGSILVLGSIVLTFVDGVLYLSSLFSRGDASR